MAAAVSKNEMESTQPLPILRGTPLLGHLPAFQRDRTESMLALARAKRDIVHMPMGLFRMVPVTSPVLANEVLTTKVSAFVKSPGMTIFLKPVLGEGLLTSENPVHERQRKLLAPAFAHKRIAAYAATMAERADRMASRFREGEKVDVADAMMRLTFEIVGKTLFDAEVGGDAAVVGKAIETVMTVMMKQIGSFVPIPPSVPTPANLRYRRAVNRLNEVIYRIIRERRAEGGDRGDVLSMLLKPGEDGAVMTDQQVRDESMTLLGAGHETTANALSWTFYLLARHPDVRSKMEAELDQLTTVPTYDDLKKLPFTLAVFKESMRLYPPAWLIGRRATRDLSIGGYRVKKNSIVLINILGLHRRPDLWPDPDRFDPERFVGEKEKHLPRCTYMPFGAGPRVCIGNHFAVMEGHVLLATLARKVRFDLESQAPVTSEPLVTLRPKGGIQTRVSLRSAC